MEFAGRLAVVTGGGAGIGRELVLQLAAQGCSVAFCDIAPAAMQETAERARAVGRNGCRISWHTCDVSNESDVLSFRDQVVAAHNTDQVNLVFNNAGIASGNSFIAGDRAEWDRTFAVCWGGVYNTSRAFVPLLIASDRGCLVNVSSVNGFWACLGPGVPHTAYSTAKFAVKGFSEALLEDFRLHAPHVTVALAMPGHVGTDIIANSRRILTNDHDAEHQAPELLEAAEQFKHRAPQSAQDAARTILEGIRADRWRIPVGDDAVVLDEAVRADPLGAYGPAGFRLPTFAW